jgi:phosphoglycolate phosphatase-like HAD superfamily hydrolase
MININYKVFLFDFDGVIINSNEIREFGFRQVLRKFDADKVDLLIDFHNANGGLSRYVKFKYFYNEILHKDISRSKINSLALEFSQIMLLKLSNTKYLIKETLDFIKYLNEKSKILHIVSGSDEAELNILCKNLKLDHLFSSIKGSPKSKEFLVRNIVDNNSFEKEDYCLIGDSINDFDAANHNGIMFFGYNNLKLKKNHKYIQSFNDLNIKNDQ